LFWPIAYAKTKEAYEAAIAEIAKENLQASAYISKKNINYLYYK
jgi:hypothetical protein